MSFFVFYEKYKTEPLNCKIAELLHNDEIFKEVAYFFHKTKIINIKKQQIKE